MKAKEFEEKFDNGEDITEELDLSKVRHPEHKQRGVNVDHLGVTRQSIH